MEDLEARIANCQERMNAVNERIRTLLAADSGDFVTRATRAAFVEHPDVSASLSDQQLTDIKASAATLGTHQTERVLEALGTPDVWEHDGDEPEDGWSLEGIPQVWGPVRAVEDTVAALLEEHGLDAGPAVRYKAPRFFVGGEYLPSLGEHHWGLRRELLGLHASAQGNQEAARRSSLAERWDNTEH